MKDLKKKAVIQELSKEEATSVYGGATKAYIRWVVRDGKIAWEVAKSK